MKGGREWGGVGGVGREKQKEREEKEEEKKSQCLLVAQFEFSKLSEKGEKKSWRRRCIPQSRACR